MIFHRAKIRLAMSFAVVQLVLFAAFGFGIYAYVTTAFDFDVAESDSSAVPVESAFAALRTGILLAYIALVFIIPLTSYGLATLAMRPIRAAYIAQQGFVDDASHELRTPLTAIQAQLELGLHRPRLLEEYRTVVERSLHSAGQLGEILDDLLVLSRGEADTAVEMAEVEVGSILDAAVELLPPLDAARVEVRLPHELVVSASSSMLSRAVTNLLTNALHYSHPSSKVVLTADRRAGMARIMVEDHGVGMSAAERSKAFDRFWRADASRSSTGRGLGLSIVSRIVSMHGGRVDLASELGVGSVATIELPLSR